MTRLTDSHALTPRRVAPRSFALISVLALVIVILLFPILRVHEAYKAPKSGPVLAAQPITLVQDT